MYLHKLICSILTIRSHREDKISGKKYIPRGSKDKSNSAVPQKAQNLKMDPAATPIKKINDRFRSRAVS